MTMINIICLVNFVSFVKYIVNMNMHEFKNIDDVCGSKAMVCNRIVVIFLYSLMSMTSSYKDSSRIIFI